MRRMAARRDSDLKPELVMAVGKLAIGQFLNELPILTELSEDRNCCAVDKFGLNLTSYLYRIRQARRLASASSREKH